MARLIVEALSEDTIAAPGDRDANYIVVSVTTRKGEPVTTLGQANFSVDAIIVGPGGALVDIDSVVHNVRLPGTYIVRVKPINTETWKSGVYIFGIAVQRGKSSGQALASVLMD